jgi:paraquat-inducible protein A
MNQNDLPSIDTFQLACHECDLLQHAPELEEDETAHCIRCEAILFRNQKNSVDRSLAFAVSGLLFYIMTNSFPLLSLEALGFLQEGTLFSTSLSLFQAGMPLLSIVLFLTTIVFPLTTLLGTIYILLQVKRNKFNDYTAPVFRFLRSTDAWGMLEIFMLAILVSMVKLGDYADVIFGISLYSFILLILCLTLLSHSLNPQDVWRELRNNVAVKK